LVIKGAIIKIGRAPKVFYQVPLKIISSDYSDISIEDRQLLLERFIQVTEDGRLLEGIAAFDQWCTKRNLPLAKTLVEYKKTIPKYDHFKDEDGLITGTQKLKNTKGFETIAVDKLYYADFYAIERFGKTKLGQLLHFAKQGQNMDLTLRVINMISPLVQTIVKKEKIDAIGFIPPTINRQLQIMSVMKEHLSFSLPIIQLQKIKGEIVVPQKALSKLPDRISNARTSIIATERRNFNSILLVDDAVGSGATINETALKIRKRALAKRIVGFAATGSYKGFEVISEA